MSSGPSPQKKSGEDVIRNVSDFRTLKCFANLLNSISAHPIVDATAIKEKTTLKQALINHLATAYSDAIGRSDKANWLISEAANNLIPLEQFDWLKENEDACIAIWGHLSSTPNRRFHGCHTNNSLIDKCPDKILYQQMSLPQKPTSHKERLDAIKNYFDTWVNCSHPLISKSNTMENMKNMWLSMLKEVKVFTWLTKPEREQCEWAWDYLNDYHRKETAEMRPGIYELTHFHPINDHEKFLAIYAAKRIWNPHKAEKTLLLKNMNRAWRERQRRRDREDKKAINSYVDVKVKKRLDLLARYNRCQINEVLTDLINKEYRRLEAKIREQFDD